MATELIVDCSTGQAEIVSLPAPTLAELKARKATDVDRCKDEILLAGYHPTHPSLSGKVLQNRPEDRDNWNMALAIYQDAVLAGQGAVVGGMFRTADNTTVTLSFSDAVGVLRAFRTWGLQVLAASWALKDAVGNAADEAALSAIDIEAGYAGL